MLPGLKPFQIRLNIFSGYSYVSGLISHNLIVEFVWVSGISSVYLAFMALASFKIFDSEYLPLYLLLVLYVVAGAAGARNVG